MRRVLYGVHVAVLGLAGLLCIFLAVDPVHAQTGDLQRRIAVLEDAKLDHRLTALETEVSNLDELKTEVRATIGGVGILLIEAFIVRRKRREV